MNVIKAGTINPVSYCFMTDKCETSSLFARPYEIRDGCRLSLAQLEQNECLYVLPLYREMCVCVSWRLFTALDLVSAIHRYWYCDFPPLFWPVSEDSRISAKSKEHMLSISRLNLKIVKIGRRINTWLAPNFRASCMESGNFWCSVSGKKRPLTAPIMHSTSRIIIGYRVSYLVP